MDKLVPYVVVTGVSSGIGRAIATMLVAGGYHVFGSVRNEKDARSFEAEFGGKAGALVFDVTDEAAIARAARTVGERLEGETLAGLVNNAGIDVNGPLQFVSVARLREQMEVNYLGLMAVTQAFLPLLGAIVPPPERPGRIINISSVAGLAAMPMLGPYSAAKFAVEAASDCLRRELMIYGIDVCLIEPGPVQSAIFEKHRSQRGQFSNTVYAAAIERFGAAYDAGARRAAPAEAVGRLVLKILSSRRPKTRYTVPEFARLVFGILKLMPDRMVDRLLAKRLRLKRLGN
jgi:NAD(P)-dependent dehydrogenase (short-subunit alcohol dehydrogenase family)